jgi:DNA-directed RNA polymerase I subunit RPA2
MERDALLAHGTSFLLQDRLMNCSDYSTAWVCRACGSMVSLGYDSVSLGREIGRGEGEGDVVAGPGGEFCRVCREAGKDDLAARKLTSKGKEGSDFRFESIGSGGDMEVVAVPFVFRLLLAELASMGIAVSVGVD